MHFSFQKCVHRQGSSACLSCSPWRVASGTRLNFYPVLDTTKRSQLVCHATNSSTLPRKLDGQVDWEKVDWNTYDWRDYVDEDRGPAYNATLQMLDWASLCSHVAAFASTTVGKQRCMDLDIAPTLERAQELQRETQTAELLETQLSTTLDFGGVNTDSAASALRRAAKGGMLPGELLLALGGLLSGAERLQRLMRAGRNAARGTHMEESVEVLAGRLLGLNTCPGLSQQIANYIGEHGEVRESASDAVKRTRQAVATLEGRLRGILKNHGGEITTHAGRLCVSVPSGESPRGVLLGSGAGGSTVYVEPTAAVAPNNALVAARAEAMAAEEAVLWQLTSSAIDRLTDLRAVLDVVVWLDVVVARYRYSAWMEGVYPEFVDFPWLAGGRDAPASGAGEEEGGECWVYLRRLRHPLLQATYLQKLAEFRQEQGQTRSAAAASRFQNRKDTAPEAQPSGESVQEPTPPVPVDIAAPLASRAVIITGPNTGGKTATLKGLGLAALMSKAGLALPCAAPARLPPFSAVLADIGDEQSLSASLSTFSGHLKRIQALRAEADGRCLVLLDELGTGTDPLEGSALGLAILQRLAEGGVGGGGLTVCTTHLSALTGLKYEDAAFENASAEFDEDALAPTYRLLWGVPGRSNAFNIAARLGLPGDVIAEARELRGASQGKLDDLINSLEVARQDLDRHEAAAERQLRQAAELEDRLARVRAREAESRAVADVARAEIVGVAARKAVASLNRMSKQQMALDKEAAAKEAAERAEQAAAERQAAKLQQQAAAGWRPSPGDLVQVPKLGGTARVTSVAKNKLQVEYGRMSVSVKVTEVLQV